MTALVAAGAVALVVCVALIVAARRTPNPYRSRRASSAAMAVAGVAAVCLPLVGILVLGGGDLADVGEGLLRLLGTEP